MSEFAHIFRAPSMDSIAVKKAGEIESPTRQWLNDLFGRTLGDDEQVTIFIATPHTAPVAGDRRQAFERASRILDKAAANMRDVSDAEFEEAVDEAQSEVRRQAE